MKVKKVLTLLVATIMVMSLTLSGCSKKEEETTTAAQTTAVETTTAETTTATEETTAGETTTAAPTEATTTEAPATQAANESLSAAQEAAAKFPLVVNNTNASIDGGVLKVALVSSSNFKGIMNPAFYDDNYDAQVLGWFTEPIVNYDENFVMDQEGAASYEYDKDAKTITLKMKDGVKWHDGVPVTLDDLVYAYEIISHKDYDGIRYDEGIMNVVGVEEYNAGTADKISGLELKDDNKTLVMHFKEFYPSMLVGGIWTNPIPRHYFEGIAVKDMAADPKSRLTPIGFGPFKFVNTVPGESVKYERFDDYWLGKPKLAGIELKLISPDLVPQAMKEGTFDVAMFGADKYPDYMSPTNYQYVGQIHTVFSYTGFKLGKWDAEKNTVVTDPTLKMSNVKLRQAIGYAVDNNEIGQSMYSGLRFLATTVITPRHASYQNKDLVGYDYQPEKSKALLDEAGYKDIDGDGYREDPQGNQFSITWATMDGGATAEPYAQFKIQSWKDVGLRVELYNGRLTEFNAFYEAVEADDPAIDMYDGAWQTGYDPDPASLWGKLSGANYTRYSSDTFDADMAAVVSADAWDPTKLSAMYKKWQEDFFNECPAIPTMWRMNLEAVNNRVKNYSIESTDIKLSAHLLELTADNPEVAK